LDAKVNIGKKNYEASKIDIRKKAVKL